MMKTNEEYFVEIKKLADGLLERNICFSLAPLFDGFQIIVKEDGERLWDAVCHSSSYGHEDGLLEIYGTLVPEDHFDEVEGWLTAEDILARV